MMWSFFINIKNIVKYKSLTTDKMAAKQQPQLKISNWENLILKTFTMYITNFSY
jgi:hypothetical protein